MPNKHRGEIEACFDGQPFTLCLTLGALAELESAFGDDNMLALAERFQSGRISALDATRILGAGLRGAGHILTDSDVAKLRTDSGAAGYVTTVAQLLAATFGGPVASAVVDAVANTIPSSTRDNRDGSPDPFPGPR
jgi:hypothetical protein